MVNVVEGVEEVGGRLGVCAVSRTELRLLLLLLLADCYYAVQPANGSELKAEKTPKLTTAA